VARVMVWPLSRGSLVVLAAITALGVAGCGEDTAKTTPQPSTAVPTANAGVGGPKTSDSPSVPASASASAPLIADGRHAAYLTKLDVGAKTLTFDKIDFLTGAAAKKAYLKENPGETDGPPNDYMIVNNNKLLRTLPIADSATITIVDMSSVGGVGVKKTTLAALPAYFAADKGAELLWHDPFWLTVKSGQITKIQEQFLP